MQVRGNNPAENFKTTTVKVKILTGMRSDAANATTNTRHRTETSARKKAVSAPMIASTRNVTIYNVINISFIKKRTTIEARSSTALPSLLTLPTSNP